MRDLYRFLTTEKGLFLAEIFGDSSTIVFHRLEGSELQLITTTGTLISSRIKHLPPDPNS